MCQATSAIAELGLNLGVVCDVALDPYTSHGQDGLVRDGYVVNDETLDALVKQAINQAQAGATVIAPSDMMDDPRWEDISERAMAIGFETWPVFLELTAVQ